MNQQSFIYNFLLSPRFRVWRYLSLVVFFTIISLNQALAGYLEFIPQIGNEIYCIVAITIVVYIISVLGISKIASKYLLVGRYSVFIAYILACAVLYMTVSNMVYSYHMVDYDFFSEVMLIDNLSSFSVYLLCISGIIIPLFLKNWVISNRHLNQLKIKQAASQVEQFKEQINPPSFFKILSKSKESVKTEPDKASTMLMKLSQLLRYQLYDCNRKQVFLTGEVSFLRNFLELEKLYSPKFDYTIEIEGNINGVFISPSILLPYVQSIINTLDNEKEHHIVHVELNNTNNTLGITLKAWGVGSNILLQKELLKVRDRLNTLYEDCYKLTVADKKDADVAEIVLQLDKI